MTSRADHFFVAFGAALFALFLAMLITAGAALAGSPSLFLRPPYVGTRFVLTNRGWQRDVHRRGRGGLQFGPKYPA